MNYKQILIELKEVDLSSIFDKEFKDNSTISIYNRINVSQKIHSTASLIRHLISYFAYESERWIFWQKVLFYFMSPKFCRIKNF